MIKVNYPHKILQITKFSIHHPFELSKFFYYEIVSHIVKVRPKVIFSIPYFSQWESREAVDFFFNEKISLLHDPSWKKSGAISAIEYHYWSHNLSAMVCLKMILFLKFHREFQTIPLLKIALSYNVYKLKFGEVLGIFPVKIPLFLKKEFNIRSIPVHNISLSRIFYEMNKENFFMAKVDTGIRNPDKGKLKKNNYVLITGYDLKKELFYIHNPVGIYRQSQENAQVSFREFRQFFLNRGVIIKNDWMFEFFL